MEALRFAFHENEPRELADAKARTAQVLQDLERARMSAEDMHSQAVVIEARAIYWTNRTADEIVAHTATMRRLMTAVER